jgi:hypothetical protein
MAEFQAYLLRFRGEVIAPLQLPAAVGAALRGALFNALQAQFCLAGRSPGCGAPELARHCPVCFLLAPVDTGNRRGRDVPRPYVLAAPFGGPMSYAPGQVLEFGLTTFGRALNHFPYALLGVEEMGRRGLGNRRRGAYRLEEVWVENPLLGRQEAVYQRARDGVVRVPSLAVTPAQVEAEAARLAARGGDRRLRLDFLSPTRLVLDKQLVRPERFSFVALAGRLLERLTGLFEQYAGTPPPFDAPALLRAAEQVRVVEQQLVWRELFRASGRHGRLLPMSGLLGKVVLEGELAPFLPWLVWGSLTHVGKDAAMGNGRMRLEVGV